MHKDWYGIKNVPFCFARSSLKFEGNTRWKFDDLNLIKITRLVAAIKSFRLAWLTYVYKVLYNCSDINIIKMV